LLQFLDSLSVKQARQLAELLLRIFVYRPADAPSDEKHTARATQKALAQFLIDADAEWAVRELILNAGRTLYYSDEVHHSYYRDGLLELIQRTADKLGEPEQGRHFVSLVEQHEKTLAESGTGAVFFAGSVLDTNMKVIETASKLVEAAIDRFGSGSYSKSERRMLTGVVTPAVARKLNI
jgi:hypothetical protein